MPYDQFTIQQIAGDMLPEAAIEQREICVGTESAPTQGDHGPAASEAAERAQRFPSARTRPVG